MDINPGDVVYVKAIPELELEHHLLMDGMTGPGFGRDLALKSNQLLSDTFNGCQVKAKVVIVDLIGRDAVPHRVLVDGMVNRLWLSPYNIIGLVGDDLNKLNDVGGF